MTTTSELDSVEQLLATGRYDEAQTVLASLVSRQQTGKDPGEIRGRTHHLFGVCHFRISSPYAVALTHYDTALRLGYDPFTVLLHRGVLHGWHEHFEAAAADFGRAVAIQPSNPIAQSYLSQAKRVVQAMELSRRLGQADRGPLLRRDEAKYLYFAPPHRPDLDPTWLETCSIPQSMQFMVDCLPAIRTLTAGWPWDQVLTAVDVGTATGAGAALLARFYSAGFFGFRMQVDAIDISGQYKAYARAVFPEINYVVGDFFEYEPGKRWDLVHCSHTIEHLWDPWPWIEAVRQRARRWALFYAPFEEQALIPGHRLSFTEELIRQHVDPVHIEVLSSPAWRHPVDPVSKTILFVLKGVE